MPEIPGVQFAQLDFHASDAPEKLKAMIGGRADVVMSDMAANTTGHRKTDQLRIVGLVEIAVAFASEVLNPGGAFLAKVFQSGADTELLAQLKRDFRQRQACEARREPAGFVGALRAGDGVSGWDERLSFDHSSLRQGLTTAIHACSARVHLDCWIASRLAPRNDVEMVLNYPSL